MADLGQELIREARAGNKEGVGTLLEKGAPVDAEDASTGDTALMSSACNGHVDVVKLLAAKGANIHHRNHSDSTALLLAALNHEEDVCLYLISLGADPTAEDQSGQSTLSQAGESYQRSPLLEARRAYLDNQPRQLQHLFGINASLLFSETSSDLVFVCPGGERIHAHRCTVAACSPHMNALLQGPWAENAGGQASEVVMPQSAEAVRALLKFMYTGEVDAAACVSHTMDVLDLASQHEQPYLKAACANHMGETLHSKNVLSILEIALLHDFPAVKAKCIAFVLQHMAELSLEELIQFADEHSMPELRDTCDRGSAARLRIENVLPFLDAALCHDLPRLKQTCIAFVEKSMARLKVSDLVQSGAWKSYPELRAACERGCIAILSTANVVSFLEDAIQHDMPLLKGKCLALVSKHTDLVASQAFVDLATSNPRLWDELRAALGVKS